MPHQPAQLEHGAKAGSLTSMTTPSSPALPRRWVYLRPVRLCMTAAFAAALRTRATIAPQAREMLVNGGTILTSNHVSLLDGVLLALLSPAPLAVGVDSDWSVKSPWAARGMATLCWLGYGWVVPLDSSTPQGLRKLARHLREGRNVLLFPEGQISPNGRPQAERPGVRWLAERTGAKVVRASIDGAERSLIFAKAGDQLWPRIAISVN